jgi:hypothetical protein
MMRYRLFTVGPPPHEAFFTMSDAMGQTLPGIQIIYAIIRVNWAVTGMAIILGSSNSLEFLPLNFCLDYRVP